MREHNWLLGGESSGHIICSDVTSTGDGVVAALKVLFAVVSGDESLSSLVSDMTMFPQVMINVRRMRSVDLDADPGIHAAVRETEDILGNEGRVLLRPSGTEPLIRVMVEGRDQAQVHRLATDLAEKVGLLVG